MTNGAAYVQFALNVYFILSIVYLVHRTDKK
jgi:hypothetical protein